MTAELSWHVQNCDMTWPIVFILEKGIFLKNLYFYDLISPWNHSLVTWSTQMALTHWGRVRHICVSKLTIIGSDNGLSPGRCQAIICTSAGILSVGPLGTNFSEILHRNLYIFIQENTFENVVCQVQSGIISMDQCHEVETCFSIDDHLSIQWCLEYLLEYLGFTGIWFEVTIQ